MPRSPGARKHLPAVADADAEAVLGEGLIEPPVHRDGLDEEQHARQRGGATSTSSAARIAKYVRSSLMLRNGGSETVVLMKEGPSPELDRRADPVEDREAAAHAGKNVDHLEARVANAPLGL